MLDMATGELSSIPVLFRVTQPLSVTPHPCSVYKPKKLIAYPATLLWYDTPQWRNSHKTSTVLGSLANSASVNTRCPEMLWGPMGACSVASPAAWRCSSEPRALQTGNPTVLAFIFSICEEDWIRLSRQCGFVGCPGDGVTCQGKVAVLWAMLVMV